jgi:hypothetical protein
VCCVYPVQETLEGFCEKNETPYGLLTIGGKAVAATNSWWSALTHAEKALFLVFANLQMNGVARDWPVYLPVKSPSVSFFLLIYFFFSFFFFDWTMDITGLLT